ncbi:MAG TPA: phosphatidate cytidylyltransferase [Kofleriaceae bacterium]|nr:phosphatidate cytidylyltransferase [Kofleriaceae bacterium]
MALGNLAQRFLVAVVAVPIILFIFYMNRPEPTWALIFVASLLAMREFFGMTLPKEDRGPSLVFGALACLIFYWADGFVIAYYGMASRWAEAVVVAATPLLLFVVVLVPFLYYLFRFRDIPSVASRMTATITGIVYAGLLTTFLACLKRFLPLTEGGHFVVLVLLIAWLADTGGYFAGRFLGNAKLYEAVSPKKTWAGAWGGIAGSVAGVVGMKLLFLPWLSWFDVFAIAIPGGMLGQMGDLAESLIKRSVGVKDSGALLPGHGGILDRIDAVLFIAPYVYGYVVIKAAVVGMPYKIVLP